MHAAACTSRRLVRHHKRQHAYRRSNLCVPLARRDARTLTAAASQRARRPRNSSARQPWRAGLMPHSLVQRPSPRRAQKHAVRCQARRDVEKVCAHKLDLAVDAVEPRVVARHREPLSGDLDSDDLAARRGRAAARRGRAAGSAWRACVYEREAGGAHVCECVCG